MLIATSSGIAVIDGNRVGLYGLLAYAVAQRMREIGIRMALGARPARILGLIGRQALWTVACGIAIGLGAAVVAAPAVRGLLYGVAANDAATLTTGRIIRGIGRSSGRGSSHHAGGASGTLGSVAKQLRVGQRPSSVLRRLEAQNPSRHMCHGT